MTTPMPHSTIDRDDQFATVIERLLHPGEVDERAIFRALGSISGGDVDAADIYFESATSESWSLEDGRVSSGHFSVDRGAGVRAVADDRTAFAYTSDISASALNQAAAAAAAIRKGPGLGVADLDGPARRRDAPGLYSAEDPIAALDAAAKTALLLDIDARARAADPRIVRVSARLYAEHKLILIARSDGELAADIRPLVHIGIQVMAEAGDRRERGTAGGGGRYGFDEIGIGSIDAMIATAVRIATTNLDARPAPSGPMTVVLGAGYPGVLFHEAVGHGLEGDFNRKRQSAFAGRIGERIAAPGVTVIDDGSIPRLRGSLAIDDEGNPTQATTLIEDGVLVGYMQDSVNARLMNMLTTGNARRNSYASLPMPRMTNTFLQTGQDDPAEIVRSVKRGIYAASFGGGQVDIVSGQFNFSTTEAYLIEDGRITAPISGATLIGSGPESLKHIAMVGNDFAFDTGIAMCSKEGQTLPVTVGQPTLRIDDMTVGGAS